MSDTLRNASVDIPSSKLSVGSFDSTSIDDTLIGTVDSTNVENSEPINSSTEIKQSDKPLQHNVWGTVAVQPLSFNKIMDDQNNQVKHKREVDAKVIQLSNKLKEDTNHFMVISGEQVFVYDYIMQKQFYNFNEFIVDRPSFNDYTEDNEIRDFISPWYYCLRPSCRPELPCVVNLWVQCSKFTYKQPPPGLNVEILTSILNRNKIPLCPRISDKQTGNFMDFIKIVDPFKVDSDVVSLYDLARRFAAVESTDKSFISLWNATSAYLGFLMYPFRFYLYTRNDASILLNSSKYIREHFVDMGSNLLTLICTSVDKVVPAYIMMNSLWGSYIRNMYSWKADDGKREIIKLKDSTNFIPTNSRVSQNVKVKTMNIYEAAKYLFHLPVDNVAKEANRLCSKYGFKVETLHDLYNNIDENNGIVSPDLHLALDQIYTPLKLQEMNKQPRLKVSRARSTSIPIKVNQRNTDSNIKGSNLDKPRQFKFKTLVRSETPKPKAHRSKSRPRAHSVLKVRPTEPFTIERGRVVISKTFNNESNTPVESVTKHSQTSNKRNKSNKKVKDNFDINFEESKYPRNITLVINPINKTINEVIQKPHSAIQYYLFVAKRYKIPIEELVLIVSGKEIPHSKELIDLPNNSRLTFQLKAKGGMETDESSVRGQLKQKPDGPYSKYFATVARLAKKFAGNGIPLSAFLSVNYNAGGNSSSSVFTAEAIIARNEFLNEIGRLPPSPFPEIVKYFDNAKLRPSLNFIENQFEQVPNCPWDIVPNSKVSNEQLEYMRGLIPQRKFYYPYVCKSNYNLKSNVTLYTKDKAMSRVYQLAFRSIQESYNGEHFIGGAYLNAAEVLQDQIGDDTYKITLNVLYSGPSLVDPDDDLNLTNKYVGTYLPTRRTNGYARLNYPMVNSIGTPPEFMEPYLVDLYNEIADNSLTSYRQSQAYVKKVISEHIQCTGTISGQIIRFSQCMFTRHKAVRCSEDPYWRNPIEIMHFIPIFDLRTMHPSTLGRLYVEHPMVKVNIKASTGLFTNNQSRNLLVRISDGKLCSQWLTLIENCIKNKDLELLSVLDSLAMVAEMKPKDEVIERAKMFIKTRIIYVLNSFTQAPLNVLFTGSETEFMSRAREDLTFPLLLGIDPAEWLINLIDEIRQEKTCFDSQRYWYYSYSDNVYCYDHKDKLLYSFDGVKMESSIRGEDVIDLLSSLSSYKAVSEFAIIGDEEAIRETIHRLPKLDIGELKAFYINVPNTDSLHHSPFALDGRHFDLSSAYDRVFINRVVFYLKSEELLYKYAENMAYFTVLCINNGKASSWWKHYVKIMGNLCEDLQCYLGESMLKSHFLPSGAQYTALVNSYKTLGSVLVANENQTDPLKFGDNCKCWLCELENVGDLKPIINKDHTVKNIRLDFLGLDATCELGFWSLILREGALYSGPAYGDYVAKKRDLRAMGNQFSMYCAAVLNGIFNRPFYCSLIIGQLATLSVNIMLNDETVRLIVDSLNQQLGVSINTEFFNKPDFWIRFFNLAINRLKLEDFPQQKLFVSRIDDILHMPEMIDIEQPTIEEMIQSKYEISKAKPLDETMKQFIEGEDLINKLQNLDANTTVLIQTFGRMIAREYQEFYFRAIQQLTSFLIRRIGDDTHLNHVLKQNMTQILYS